MNKELKRILTLEGQEFTEAVKKYQAVSMEKIKPKFVKKKNGESIL